MQNQNMQNQKINLLTESKFLFYLKNPENIPHYHVFLETLFLDH